MDCHQETAGLDVKAIEVLEVFGHGGFIFGGLQQQGNF